MQWVDIATQCSQFPYSNGKLLRWEVSSNDSKFIGMNPDDGDEVIGRWQHSQNVNKTRPVTLRRIFLFELFAFMNASSISEDLTQYGELFKEVIHTTHFSCT